MLFILRKNWAPSAFCVSFKVSSIFLLLHQLFSLPISKSTMPIVPNTRTLQLETDPNILLQKAEMALKKYGMNVVVANELANYKDVVVMVTSSGRTTVSRSSKEEDLEEQLTELLVKMHLEHIRQPRSEDR